MSKKQTTITRHSLAKILYPELGSTSEAYRFVGVFFDTLSDEISRRESTKIHGFGTFRCINKRSRVGRNPKTGREVAISARRVVSFIASNTVKREITNHGKD